MGGGGMHGGGHEWLAVCMARRHAWQGGHPCQGGVHGKGGMLGKGVCMVGGMHGGGTCMVGGMHGGGTCMVGGMHGGGHAWWVFGVHDGGGGCAWQEKW